MAKTKNSSRKGARKAARGVRGQGPGERKRGDVLRHVQKPERRQGFIGQAAEEEKQQELSREFDDLLAKAELLLEEGPADEAVSVAEKALEIRTHQLDTGLAPTGQTKLPALNVLALIHLENGDLMQAREAFLNAVAIDIEGSVPFTRAAGGGVEKYFYLSQLSEEGGQDSIDWLEKGAAILRREIAKHEAVPAQLSSNDKAFSKLALSTSDLQQSLPSEPKTLHNEPTTLPSLQAKLARALCSQIEIHMTDLSFLPESESHCERLIAEALHLAKLSRTRDPTTLQTLANIRISQCRIEEAKAALLESLKLWGGDLIRSSLPGSPISPITSSASKATLSDDEEEEEEGHEPAFTTEKAANYVNAEALAEQPRGVKSESDALLDPDFPTRISLSRLLLECNLLSHAFRILERLVEEDDLSVEAWYLGGWCLYLLVVQDSSDGPDKMKIAKQSAQQDKVHISDGTENEDAKTEQADLALEYLSTALRLCESLDYEDDRLRDHAGELVLELETLLGRERGSTLAATTKKTGESSMGMEITNGNGDGDEDDEWESDADEMDEN